MKKFIINKCMNAIKNNKNYSNDDLEIIEYGLVGIYLTISKLIIIFILAIILGIMKEVLILLLIYNILRATAFGLHATKSWICLISSIFVFIGIPLVCINLSINIYIKIILDILCVIYIYKFAPADTYKRPIVSIKRRNAYKYISTLIAIIYSLLSIFIKSNYLSNCFIFSMIIECFLISPLIYKLFNLPYNNYLNFLKEHPEYNY